MQRFLVIAVLSQAIVVFRCQSWIGKLVAYFVEPWLRQS